MASSAASMPLAVIDVGYGHDERQRGRLQAHTSLEKTEAGNGESAGIIIGSRSQFLLVFPAATIRLG
jgi:hypothetical protein